MQERLQMKIDRAGVKLENDATLLIIKINMYIDQKYFHLSGDFWLILK